MQKYVGLLRGINIGGHNILPMQDLRNIFTTAGCENVQTYIQSGNVVFSYDGSPAQLVQQIKKSIQTEFAFTPELLVLSKEVFQNALLRCPYQSRNGKDVHYFFLAEKPMQPDLDKLTALKADSEEFFLADYMFYFFAPDGIGRSKLAAQVEKLLKVPTTGRNFNTVQQLLVMLG